MNETPDTFRRRPRRGRRTAVRRTLARRTARRTALFGGAVVIGATLPVAGLAAAAQAADPGPDTTAPVSTFHQITAPASGWFRSSTPIQVTGDDPGGSGVASVSFRVDGGETQSFPGAASGWLPISGDGEHTIEYWSTDNAGNVEASRTAVRRIDATPPTVQLPDEATFVQGSDAPFAYECDDELSGLVSCLSPVAQGESLSTVDLGVHYTPVTALDVAGNETTVQYRYVVVGADTTAPAVAIHVAPEPASGWYTSYLGIQFTAEDASGIASLHWNSEGAISTNGDVFGEGWDGFDLTVDGITEFDAWAFDTAGNRGAAEHRTVRIDTVAPRIDLVSPELPNPVSPAAAGAAAAPTLEFEQGETVPLEYDCTDEHSGLASCSTHGEMHPFGAVEGAEASEAEVLPTDELGEHTVTLHALDVAGNTSEFEVRYLVVEPDEEPGGGNGGNGGGNGNDGDSGEPGQGAGGAQQPGRSDAPGRDSGSGDALAETGFPIVPGLIAVGGLLAAGAVLMTAYSRPRRRR